LNVNNNVLKFDSSASKRQRYKPEDILARDYYELPKFLFNDEFSSLGNDAKVLYALLKEEYRICIINNQIDDEGYLYFQLSREDMQGLLNVSKPTVIKAVNELKKYALLEEERLGKGNLNRMYLTF
jgi:hypothetical protein